MRTKKEIADEFRSDSFFKQAIESTTGDDRKVIAESVEHMFVDLLFSMEEFIEKVNADPVACAEFMRVISGDTAVVNSEPHATGSLG